MTAYLWAVHSGHPAAAHTLVEAGADPTAVDASGLGAAELARENAQVGPQGMRTRLPVQKSSG